MTLPKYPQTNGHMLCCRRLFWGKVWSGCLHFLACLFCLPILLPVLLVANAHADNAITGLRLGPVELDIGTGLRVVVEQDKPVAAQLLLLDSPYRLVIDSPDTHWNVSGLTAKGSLSRAPASGYRFGSPAPGVGRLVIELDAPAAPVRAFTLPPRQAGDTTGHRLVIDLVDRGPTAFRLAQAALRKQPFIAEKGQAAEATTQSAQTTKVTIAPSAPSRPALTGPAGVPVSIAMPAPRPQRWVVTIDAGHGGKDPGAIGGRGTREKEVTLKAARRLAAHLQKSGRVVVRLTREDDRFIRLRQRINIARMQGADVFISLHADAAQSKSAHGISVFSLSDVASDKEAAYLAKQENQADLIGGPDLSEEDPVAANELLRMFQRESMNESTYLAKFILQQIGDLRGGTKRGHRFAGFAVLKSPDVPSVLVEMGFLTNSEDERNLRMDSYIDKVAERLARAIIAYLEQSGR